MDYSGYLRYCETKAQRRALEALIQHGTQKKASKALGVAQRSLERMWATVRDRAHRYGYSPSSHMDNGVEPGLGWTGTSTLLDFREQPQGEKLMQWVKTSPDKAMQDAAMKEAIEAFKSEIPKSPKVKAPKNKNKDLLCQYTITDYHIGMLAWDDEAGEDWDTKIAEDLLIRWFKAAVDAAPDSESCIFAELGDFEHYDGLESVTPQSGHVLDADTRMRKLIRTSIRVTMAVVDMLLKKHKYVYCLFAEGNHNPTSSGWRTEGFAAFYENNPRVIIDTNPDVYYCHEHGKVSLFYHHGHKRNMKNIDDVFVAKFREVFGRTKYSYAHMGHKHHDAVAESNLMKVEQHRTLAAKDAYASRGGWMADRSAKVIVYHKDYGEVSRITLTPEMV